MINFSKNQYAIADVLSRLFLAAIFAYSGINKILNYSGTSQYMEGMGVPSLILPIVIAIEVIGSLYVIFGFKIRITAFILAGFCVSSALLFHFNLTDHHFLKNIAMAGGFLALFCKGADRYSLDFVLASRVSNNKANYFHL
ncbi:MAG: DoxX family protein [Gammaproteobacteria bacterium]|nr:DoxX family protein [Gammaproteobacteria bacterium]